MEIVQVPLMTTAMPEQLLVMDIAPILMSNINELKGS
jgi:hypothetical protein